MKLSEIYRRAAKDIKDGSQSYCCVAIAQYNSEIASNLLLDNFAYRLPRKRHYIGPEKQCALQGGINDAMIDSDGRRNIRVLMLCFAAAIAESEGK